MDLNAIPLFAMLGRNMAWLNRNQQVLAENIAHADTPDYRARTLKPLDFKAMLSAATASTGPVRTHPNHIVPTASESGFAAIPDRDVYETSPSGNSVNLEEQAVAMSKNAMDYQTATAIYTAALGMINTALGRGR
jgi:flagellar basal-body rod protein FlgB